MCPEPNRRLPTRQAPESAAWLLPDLGSEDTAVYAVPSASQPGRAHVVRVDVRTGAIVCDDWCPAFHYRDTCAHITAVRAILTPIPDTELAPVTAADRAALAARAQHAEQPARWISGADALRRLSETEDAYPMGGRR